MKTKQDAFVILVPGFPKNESDTTCLPAQQAFVRALHEKYPLLNLIVISFQYPFEASHYKWHQVRVSSFGGKNKGGLSRLFLWQRIRKYFTRLTETYQIKGLLCFWCGECSLVGKSLAARYQIPFQSWIMGQDAGKDNKYVRRIRPHPNELIAISDFTAAAFEKNHGIRPRHVIPLGIDPKLFKHDISFRDIDLLGAGSLIPLKQFKIFIKLVKEIRESIPHIRAVICGNGPEETKLRALINELDLSLHIQLTGERSHAEVIELMKRTRILLHPSAYEGFSGVCQEALAAGAHVISFTKPMTGDLPHWHIVTGPDDMLKKLIALLNGEIKHESQIPYPLDATLHSVMKLFGQ